MKKDLPDDVMRKLGQVSLLILDVDGVLTDGRIIMDDLGRESKHFDVKDGHGIKLLLRMGIDVIFLTGRRSRVVANRAMDLGVREVHQGVRDKAAVFDGIVGRRTIPAEKVAYVGDDIVDIPLFKRVGVAIAVADACPEVLEAAHYVTVRKGGRGAVREVCEWILRAQGKWGEVLSRYGNL